ncbi:hypothetical protein SNE40_021469 [Patella caerulea]|uniref:Uncharacterized protein n=1 Tax=Patella caerulea TaxID=87958 RepID=A0AAN8GGQ6_PATCE
MISSTGIVNPTPALPETTPNPKSVAKIPGMTTPEPIPRGPLRSLRMPARPPSQMTPKPTTVETKQIDIDALRSLRMPARPSQTISTTPKEKPIDISKLRSFSISVCPSQETTPEPTTPKPQPIVNGQLRILRRPTRLSPETTPGQATKKSVTTQNPTSPEQKQMAIGELKLQRMPANKPQETTPNTTESEPLSVVNLRILRRPVALAAEMTTTLTTSKLGGLLSLTRTQRLTSQTVQPTNPESKPTVISGVQSTEKTAIPSTPQKKSVTCDCESSRTGSTTRTPGTDEAAREGDSSIAGATSPLDTPAADDLLDEDKGDSGESVSVTSFIIKGGVGHSDDQGLPLGKGVTETIGLPKRKGNGVTELIGLPKKKDKDVPDKGGPVDFEGENPDAKSTRSPGNVLADKAELVDFEEENPIVTAKNTRFPGNVLPDEGELVDFEGENPFLGEDGQPIDLGGSNSDDQLKEDGFLTDENGDAIDGGWMDAARNPIVNTGEDTKSKTPLPRGP